MWAEGMTERSQAARLAHVLMDSIGPRLNGSPGYTAAADWLQRLYAEWGITVRREAYGTWPGWQSGRVDLTLTSPRVQNHDATMRAWSPGAAGPVEADVVVMPELQTPQQATAWLETVRGKVVLASPAEASCREPQSVERLATPETYQALRDE